MQLQTAYKTLGFDIKDYLNAYHLFENEVSLPLHTKLTDEEVKNIDVNSFANYYYKTDDEDEYRIIENNPITNRYIPPLKNNSVNCASFIAGIIEGILNSADFRCKVSAFFFEQDGITKTLYIIKFDKDVINRDTNMK